MFLHFNKFFAVDDKAGAGNTIDLDATPPEETYDLLGEDETEVLDLEEGVKDGKKAAERKPKEKEVPEEPLEETESEDTEVIPDELAELEKELEEPDEDQLELVTPVRRREILAKYPKLFKEFPYLEKAYYRDQQFTEIYPTINDAREANEKASTLDQYEHDLMQGNTETVLKTIKQGDEKSFHRIVDNYMLALYNTDQTAYHHVVANLNKQLIGTMVQEGKKMGNEALIQAAALVNQFIFSSAEWTPPTRMSKEEADPRQDQIQQREQEFNQRQFETARNDLGTRLSNSFKATIEQNIDKNNQMTAYVKNAACQDALSHLERLIGADKRFQRLKDKLWIAAAEQGYSKPAMDRIRSAFASTAKTLLPAVLKRARNEALRGLGKRREESTEDVNDGSTQSSRKPRETTPSPRSSGNTFKDKAQKIPRGMSTLEFFNSD